MINEVRNTVLSVLNKNNYGYISPSDFNLFAENAQMEIFEDYFKSYNNAINAENARTAGSDYAEIEGPIAETLEGFLVANYLAHLGSNKYAMPSLTTTGDDDYYILKMLCHTKTLASGSTTSVLGNSLVDANATFLSDGLTVGDIVVNITTGAIATLIVVNSNTTIVLNANIFTFIAQNYAIFSKALVKEADKVSVGKITMLNASSLTSPTEFYPSYTLEGEVVSLFPNTINAKGKVECVYFRLPKVPKWTYVTLISGEPAFDQSQPDYQDFELPLSDNYVLVMKILQYCGISIRETEVAQFGMVQEQQINQL